MRPGGMMSVVEAKQDSAPVGGYVQPVYPVNIRVTLPFFPQSYFVTLIIGREKRFRDRLMEERSRHPLNTWGNLLIVVTAWTILTIAALFTASVVSAL